MLKRNFTITVPAGTYWLGDPCYAVPREYWMELLNSCDHFNQPQGTAQGFAVYAASTAYGDGEYPGSDGFNYPVDAGLIGLTPVDIAENEPFGCQQVTFNESVQFGYNNGTIFAGDIAIQTNADDYDFEDDLED